MSITADNSWDTRDGFSVPNGLRKTRIVSDSQANILGVEERQSHRLPGSCTTPVGEGDLVGKLESLEDGGDSGEDAAWSRAIGMWLEWSSAYEEVAGRIFEEGEVATKLEALLDEMDQLRLEAVELSEGLLDY